MKQIRITAEHFNQPADSAVPDAAMDPQDLAELKKLAGIPVTEDDDTSGRMSPLGSNSGYSAGERASLVKQYMADPGSPLWMMIMFTHQNTSPKTLPERIEEYLQKHPKERVKPRPLPGQ